MRGLSLGRTQKGFTIIEVLIVLAVSGALFLSAILLVNGRQHVTAFNQSIRNLQTELQQVVNEVGSGYYANNGSIACDKGGPGGGVLLTSATGTEQGANMNCLFLGKAIQFAVGNTDPEVYNVYTIVGLRGSAAVPSTDLATARARLIARTTSESSSTIPPNAFETKKLQYGLTVSEAYRATHLSTSHGSVGIASKLGVIGTGDASQQVDVVPIAGSTLHASSEVGVGQINAALLTATPNPTNSIDICFNSAGSNQSGLISIGGSGRQGTVKLQIFSTKDCV